MNDQIQRIRAVESLKEKLPDNNLPYTDKYFIRSLDILKGENLDPWVRAQVFIRDNGRGARIFGLNEAIAVLLRYGGFERKEMKIYALEEGAEFGPAETVLLIEAPVQRIITLETMCLGVLSSATARNADGIHTVDLKSVTSNVRRIVEACRRPVIYMGARHWDFREDAAISGAAFEGGAASCSTDVGAAMKGQEGGGTIPHALESVMAWKYGRERAVIEAVKGFDRWIAPEIPRIALIDFNNRELSDSVAVARAVGSRLNAVRIDTCMENLAEGAIPSSGSQEAARLRAEGVPLISAGDPDAPFWYGHGVTVTAVYALRRALDEAGFRDVGIVLSSGFAHIPRVQAFVRAEEMLGIQLFNVLGVGQVFQSRTATLDIVRVGDSPDTLEPFAKAGRSENANPRLSLVHFQN